MDEETPLEKFPLYVNAGISLVGFVVSICILPRFYPLFIDAKMCGKDMSKKTPPNKDPPKVPEGLGVIAGAIFLNLMFLFIPVPFWRTWIDEAAEFPHERFVEFVAALLSICCMIFLGFADDVLNLRWRHKLWLPTMATLPLLMVYFVNVGSTMIIIPKPLRPMFGHDLDLGVLYFVYMGMLAVFCTNAINILAGINGIEAGQSFVISISIMAFNLIEIHRPHSPTSHLFSLYFILPFTAVCAAMLYHNWYPSSLFVGDTFCYFAGMTFAVVGILGRFSKTMLLFFIPQIINFVFSVPQIFHLVPCPRHRLPKYNPKTNKVGLSYARFKTKEVSFVGWIILRTFSLLQMIDLKEGIGEDKAYTECSNFTIINLVLKFIGPTHEQTLTVILLIIQVLGSLLAFFVRYSLAGFFYDVVE